MRRLDLLAKASVVGRAGIQQRSVRWSDQKRRTSRSISNKDLSLQLEKRSLLFSGLDYSSKRLKFKMPESPSDGDLVWIDCEMTGLDSDNDTILSLACFITGPDLQLIEEGGFEAVVHHDQDALDKMGEWCQKQHGISGLTAAALASMTSPQEAADGLLQYIKTHIKEPRTALLAGNTVHTDKAFLHKPPYTPIIEYLHYRIFDVSSIKEAARRWSPISVLRNAPAKQGLHEAKADILESIAEAKYYRQAIFGQNSP